MRILFLAWRDPWHPDGGGSEVYVEEVARRLVRRGHDVAIRSAAYPGRPPLEVVDGVVHHRAGGRLSVYLRGLSHLLSREGRHADVVVDVINGLPFGTPLVRSSGVLALVHHVHREQWAIIYPDWRGRIGWFVESRITPLLYRRVQHVTVSHHSARDLAAIGVDPHRVTVIPNGLDHDAVPASTDRSPTPRLVVLSRLVPHKRIEQALMAMHLLRDEWPNLRLDVVGDGWWRDRLWDEATRLLVHDVVTFHGQVPDPERDRLLAQAWLMVLPSIKEGWGIAVTEAARLGTPTVGYASSGGLQESVCNGVTGVLVDSPEELVDAIRDLLRDPVRLLAMSKAARSTAATLDWNATAERFHEALGRAAAVSGRRR